MRIINVIYNLINYYLKILMLCIIFYEDNKMHLMNLSVLMDTDMMVNSK